MGKISKILLESLFVSSTSVADYLITGCNDENLDVSEEIEFFDRLDSRVTSETGSSVNDTFARFPGKSKVQEHIQIDQIFTLDFPGISEPETCSVRVILCWWKLHVVNYRLLLTAQLSLSDWLRALRLNWSYSVSVFRNVEYWFFLYSLDFFYYLFPPLLYLFFRTDHRRYLSRSLKNILTSTWMVILTILNWTRMAFFIEERFSKMNCHCHSIKSQIVSIKFVKLYFENTYFINMIIKILL